MLNSFLISICRSTFRVHSYILTPVAGEIGAARFAIEFAITYGFGKCRIVYDYAGIEMWATGKWKTNKPETKAYKDFFKKGRQKWL